MSPSHCIGKEKQLLANTSTRSHSRIGSKTPASQPHSLHLSVPVQGVPVLSLFQFSLFQFSLFQFSLFQFSLFQFSVQNWNTSYNQITRRSDHPSVMRSLTAFDVFGRA